MKKIYSIVVLVLLAFLAACEKDTDAGTFAPEVTTGTATNIYRKGATLSGSIKFSDNATAEHYGILYSQLRSMAEYKELRVTGGETEFSFLVPDLEPGETYYFCSYAHSGYSMSRGEVRDFTTSQSNAPVFNMPVASNPSVTGFTVTATLLDDGGSELIMSGFCWNEVGEGEPTFMDNVVNVEATGSTFKADITGLVPEKTYQVRAYGASANGLAYSELLTVTTASANEPVPSSVLLLDSTSTSITVKASVLNAGSSPVTAIGFCYSITLREPTLENATLIDLSDQLTKSEFSTTINGLTPGNTYYIRAYATNNEGTGYGETLAYTPVEPQAPGIYSLEDLIAFRDAKNSASTTPNDLLKWKDENGVYNLYADIDLGDMDWNPIQVLTADETLGGNNHTITYKKSLETGWEDGYSFGFIQTNRGRIEDLNIKADFQIAYDTSSTSLAQMGAFSLYNYGTISGCTIDVNGSTLGTVNFGGITLHNEGNILKCYCLEGQVTTTADFGGIAGYHSNATISDCFNYLSVNALADAGQNQRTENIGGIVARSSGTVTSCRNEGSLEVEGGLIQAMGGIVAQMAGGEISYCTNTGYVIFNGTKQSGVGGIVGDAWMDGSVNSDNTRIVSNCGNEGKVVALEETTGCIIGAFGGAASVMTGCTYGGGVNGYDGTEENAIGLDMRGGATGDDSPSSDNSSFEDMPNQEW
ncbi:MAG: hypothetical protein IJ511_10770 [Bacteroides sp.]|nr:hypothetical protein [Bacteroides sp.]